MLPSGSAGVAELLRPLLLCVKLVVDAQRVREMDHRDEAVASFGKEESAYTAS